MKALNEADSGPRLVVKFLHKNQVTDSNQEKFVFNEIDICSSLDHPLTLGLQHVAQDAHLIYLFFEFCHRGSLSDLLGANRRLDRPTAEFVLAQLVLAVEYLHASHIVHRDLKPDNVLFADDGFVKLSDFGLSKRMHKQEKTMTMCGTDLYMAPEIILRNEKGGYGMAVDWWALGIILYELVVGKTPFEHVDSGQVMKKIVQEKIKFAKDFDAEAKHLIKKLTKSEPAKRYGSTPETMQKIKKHSFFKNSYWEELEAKRAAVPALIASIANPKFETLNVYEYSELNERTQLEAVDPRQDIFNTWF